MSPTTNCLGAGSFLREATISTLQIGHNVPDEAELSGTSPNALCDLDELYRNNFSRYCERNAFDTFV